MSCDGEQAETVEHFLAECPAYSELRVAFLEQVRATTWGRARVAELGGWCEQVTNLVLGAWNGEPVLNEAVRACCDQFLVTTYKLRCKTLQEKCQTGVEEEERKKPCVEDNAGQSNKKHAASGGGGPLRRARRRSGGKRELAETSEASSAPHTSPTHSSYDSRSMSGRCLNRTLSKLPNRDGAKGFKPTAT